MTILPYALGIGLIAITISMFMCLIRLIAGPSVIDRLLALDTPVPECHLFNRRVGHLLGQHQSILKVRFWWQCWALFQPLPSPAISLLVT